MRLRKALRGARDRLGDDDTERAPRQGTKTRGGKAPRQGTEEEAGHRDKGRRFRGPLTDKAPRQGTGDKAARRELGSVIQVGGLGGPLGHSYDEKYLQLMQCTIYPYIF